MSARALADAVRTGALTATDAVESGWHGPAAAWERDVHAVVHADAGARARGAASAASAARTGALTASVLVKDNLCTVDYPTTCCSRILAGYRSPDATDLRLRGAGAVIAGKATWTSSRWARPQVQLLRPTHNPTTSPACPGLERRPAHRGGVWLVPLTLGSDTGGSVRQPARCAACSD
jgi:aspartyl-tRNA(Asn)/glutamyl-tRNA(Gln) amidotransferase subunit A